MLARLKADLGLAEILAALSFWRGGAVQRFESRFSEMVGQKHAIAFPYGRTGLVALLKVMGLEGREVICPAYTCVVVPHAIVTAGCTPVFVDSAEADFNMNLALLESAVSEKTGAVIITSIFGHPADLDAVRAFRVRFPHIKIIQDCAHSFLACWNGERVNVVGDAAFFGLNVSKIMTSVFGGMVSTDSDELNQKLHFLSSELLKPASRKKSLLRLAYLVSVVVAFNKVVYGLVNRLERSGFLDRFVKYYDESVVEMPSDYLISMTDVEARVGLVQCKKYEKIVAHRRQLAGIYHRELRSVSFVRLPQLLEGSTCSHFVIRTKYAVEIISYMLEHGVQLGELIDYQIPSMSSYTDASFLDGGVSKHWPGQVINLPVHMGCSIKDAERLCYLLKNIKVE